MKNIIEELNTINNMPIMQVDDSLKIYSEQNRFAKKRENATALIKRVGLPKPETYIQQKEVENTNNLLSLPEIQIRKIWHDNEWWFSIFDVIRFLTNSKNPSASWYQIKKRNEHLLSVSHKFKILSKDNKYRLTSCLNRENTFRMLMDVPSLQAENLSRWLGETREKPAYEKDPQLRFERQKELEKAKASIVNM